jgi:hypothetical protein
VTPGPHLDEDRLSALIDGEATAEDEQHVLACAGCGAKLEAWRTTLGRLTDPVPLLEATQRHVAVEAALAAAGANPAERGAPDAAVEAGVVAEAAGSPPSGTVGSAGEDGSPGQAGSHGGDGSPEEVGSAPVVGAAAPVSLTGYPRRGAARLLRLRVAAAVAAVLVIAGVVVALYHPGGSSDHPTAAPVTSVVPSSGASALAPSGVPATGGVDIDLGAYQDPAALVAGVRARVDSSSLPAPRSPAASGVAPALPPGPTPCLSRAQVYAGVQADSAPALAATATYRGERARVFLFQTARGHTVAVVGVPGCRLLATATY